MTAELPALSHSADRLGVSGYSAITFQAMLRAVPVIGSSLEHFLFGPASELRLRRLDRTLKEVAEELRARGASPRVDTEEFARLLEGVLPRLSRATNEDVRMRLRDLLLNATALPAASPRWPVCHGDWPVSGVTRPCRLAHTSWFLPVHPR